MHLTMEIMFLNVNASQSVLWNSIISLSYVLTICMKIVRPQKDNAIAEFYLHDFFYGGDIFEIFQKNQNFVFFKMRGGTLLLYELPSGNQVDGLPLAAICGRAPPERPKERQQQEDSRG